MIITGGRVFTADSTRPWAQALAIRGDRIIAVGTNAEVMALAGESTKRIALGGRVVVPGFNDAHTHLGADIGGTPFATDASPTPDPTFAQVRDSVAAISRRSTSRAWISAAVGATVLEDPMARRTQLEEASSDNPVILVGWSGHGAVLNTAALRRLGLLDAPDPVGGTLERDIAGKPTGRIDEYTLYNALRSISAERGIAPLVSALRGYDGMAASLGITSVQDMATGMTPALLREATQQGALRLRHRVIAFEMTTATGRDAIWTGAKSSSPTTTISGVKWVVDGTPVERLALMRQPYADRANWYGRTNFPADSLRVLAAEAAKAGVQPMFHAVGDSAIALVIAALRAAAPDDTWRKLRPRLEHADNLMPDQLESIKALGIVVVQNPSHLMLPLLHQRWGRERAARSDILKSIVDAGIPFAIGSDGPPSPFLNILFATINVANPSQALTREQAVIAYTRGAAYAEGMELEKGTLAPGMLADLAVLSQDIFRVAPDALPATTSVFTLVGGKPTFDKLSVVLR